MPALIDDVQLTEEQSAVVNAVAQEAQNAVVNAVAGSGKTRTALSTAIRWLRSGPIPCSQTPHVLLLAYNKRLQIDMLAQRDIIAPPSVRSFIDVRTIHGFGHRYFGGQGLTTDRDLTRWIGKSPTCTLPNFGLVIIDEAQDLTPVLFRFLHYVISLLDRPQLLVLGDPFQLLYRFKGADECYILDAHRKFSDVAADVPFHHFRLSICFRITHEMASWINENLNPNNLHRARSPTPSWFENHQSRIAEWWGHGIRADPRRPPAPESVVYYQRDIAAHGSALVGVVDEIKKVFRKYDSKSSVLLSPSIVPNQYSPVRQITSHLKNIGNTAQAWFLDKSKETNTAYYDALRTNKRIASTIHKFKGLESEAVVLVALDNFAEKVEKCDPRNVFNMFYVGATRARKKLLIVQWSDRAYATHASRKMRDYDLPLERPKCSVRRALQFCPYDATLCEESGSCLRATERFKVPNVSIDREDVLVNGAHTPRALNTMEDVSEVLWYAIWTRLKLILTDGLLIVPVPFEEDPKMPSDLDAFIKRLRMNNQNWRDCRWPDLLQISTAFLTMEDRLYIRWRQVRYFARWPISTHSVKLDECVRNMVRLLDAVCSDGTGKALGDDRAVGGVVYEKMVERLRSMYAEGRIKFDSNLNFDMQANKAFVELCSKSLTGSAGLMILSKSEAERQQKRTDPLRVEGECELDEMEGEGGVGDGVTLVLGATSPMCHNDLIEIGCYGAMYREMRLERRKAQLQSTIDQMVNLSGVTMALKEMKMPKMFLAYPSTGKLKEVELHMDSFEFLHRVGFRKVNRPVDFRVLHKSGVVEERDGPLGNLEDICNSSLLGLEEDLARIFREVSLS